MRNPFRKRSVRHQPPTLVSINTLQLVGIYDDGQETPVITTEGRISRGWIHYEGGFLYPAAGKLAALRIRWIGLEVTVDCPARIDRGVYSLTMVGDIRVVMEGKYDSDLGHGALKPIVIYLTR